jgi:hypothetical protein
LTAVITTGIAAAIFGPWLHRLKMPANERLLWIEISGRESDWQIEHISWDY